MFNKPATVQLYTCIIAEHITKGRAAIVENQQKKSTNQRKLLFQVNSYFIFLYYQKMLDMWVALFQYTKCISFQDLINFEYDKISNKPNKYSVSPTLHNFIDIIIWY